MRAITYASATRYPMMKKIGLLVCGFIAMSTAVAACGDLTGPKSPETPVNVTATLASATSVRVDWTKSPQSDGVVSYNILRNGTKVGESTTFSFTDTGLAEKTTYRYTVSANCTSGLLSDASPESAAATVITADVTPPRIILVNPSSGQTGVSTSGTVAATFNEAMDPTTLNTTTFSLKITDTGVNIPGTVTYTAATRIAEFKPTNPWPSGTSITATITTGAKDISGNALQLTAGSPGIWSFTTRDDIPPTVSSTVPANGATNVTATAPITVTFSEPMDATTITSSTITLRVTSSGSAVAGTVSYNAATRVATFTPTSTLSAPVSYTATVSSTVKDVAGNAMGTDVVFSFTTRDTTAPFVVSTSPADLATNVAANAVISAIFSKAMNPATINSTTFTLKVTASGTAVAGTVAYSVGNPGTFTPSAPLASATTYTATITTGAQDSFGNAIAANKVWTFITADNVPPTVSSVSPLNGALNVAVGSVVNITFSEPMDATTINGTNITLKTTTTGTPVTGTVSYNAGTSVATFTPAGSLSFGTGYTVTVTTGVKDVAQNALATAFPSTFTTANAPDTTAPTVTSTNPNDAATNVAINTTVSVTFSEPMDPTTVTGTTFTLKTTTGGTPVAGTVAQVGTSNTFTFTPTSPLLNNTNYTATVSTGAKDVALNPLAAAKVFTFQTIADTTPPTVLSTNPADAATAIPITSTVKVTFSEAMDAATVTAVGTFTLKVTAGGANVPGTVTYDPATRVATYTPTASLLISTNYTATVTTAARDVAGNPLSPGTVIFVFTTAP